MAGTHDTLLERLSEALAKSPVAGELAVVLLFGSASRGRLRPDSDVDVGIVPVDRELSLGRELELQAELERACGRAVDLVRLDLADPLLRWEAARAGVTLLSHPRGADGRFRAEAALEHADIAPLMERCAEAWREAVLAARGTAE